MIVIKYEIIEEETKMINVFKKMILTAALVVTTLVVFPTNAEAKTKTLTYNIDKITADKFCEDVQAQGKSAIFAGGKDKYKIVMTVKASSVKDGRAKVKKFAKKVMTADSNKYGLSYGVQMDDYNTEKYDSKKKIYTTKLFNSVNDIYYLNAITSRALRDVEYWQEHYVNNIIAVFPNNESFKKLSESAKTEFILKYLGSCLTLDIDYKNTNISWKKLYKKEQKGVCADAMNMYHQAIRLVALDYKIQDEVNYKANHGCVIAKVKNSTDDYDYYEGNGGMFSAYNANNYDSSSTIKSLYFAAWQYKAPKEFKSSKLEKEAYKFGKAKTKSDLYEVLYK